MGQVSAFLRRVEGGYSHWCPGCQEMHHIATDAPNHSGAIWSFDGNVNAPTFNPSINISCAWSEVDPEMKDERCHYFLRAGQIQFCGDSTHKLAGQAVPLPELPDGLRDGAT